VQPPWCAGLGSVTIVRERWLSPRALSQHLALAIWVPGCAVAAWWQVTVATAGNELGWVYAIEWPVFAVFGIVVWWHLIHDDPDTTGARGLRRAVESGRVGSEERAAAPAPRVRHREEEDEALAAYNDRLAALSASGRRKTWRHP
jgi:hypothetical protein